MIVAAIDPGIKNLGFCVADVSGAVLRDIIAWENYNLVSEGSAQAATRCSCGGPASWCADISGAQHLVCKKCAKKGFRGRTAIEAAVLKSADTLREFALTKGFANAKKMTKTALLLEVAKSYLMPYKPPKSKSPGPDGIYKAVEKFVGERAGILAGTTEIRIENQKSVAPFLRDIQMLLFALMRYKLEHEFSWKGRIVFVHPGSKNKDDEIEAGAAGYKDRKEAVLMRIQKKLDAWFAAEPQKGVVWKALWSGLHKKYDMSDTLHMCLSA